MSTKDVADAIKCKQLTLELLRKHSHKLKELTIAEIDLAEEDNIGPPAPQLKSLMLDHVKFESFKQIREHFANVTKLVLDYCEWAEESQDINPESLKLANLKELILAGLRGNVIAGWKLLINGNAENLETLRLHCTFLENGDDRVTMIPLPNLKTLVMWQNYERMPFLGTCCTSLQTLIGDIYVLGVVHLPVLRNLIAVACRESMSMITENSESLEFVAIGNFELGTLQASALSVTENTKLKQLVVCGRNFDGPPEAGAVVKAQQQAKFPKAKVQIEDEINSYIDAYMKNQGIGSLYYNGGL